VGSKGNYEPEEHAAVLRKDDVCLFTRSFIVDLKLSSSPFRGSLHTIYTVKKKF